MDLVEKILLIASLLTALGVIITTAIKVYKFIRRVEVWIEKTDKHDNEQYKDILRIKIMMPEMPLSERISAGDIYVNKLNGNGGVKQKYLELLKRFSEEHKE
jgi:hypothetical protein